MHALLAPGGWCIAIRHGDLPDSSMRMQGLAESRLATMASQAYLARRGEPRQPAELAGHACLVLPAAARCMRGPTVRRRARRSCIGRTARFAPTTAIRALYPARRRRNARLDVFVAHLAQTLALDLPRVGEP
ncbi:LysR substrate-binding domain-containing protein [Burkholderia gladioli]|uniref:LysR substrate-binding domain-containing protein n=3 Tax=Burkholderia gladioli TaxID=28095 RepID=UPI000565BAC1|nr:LysR substrate-binding domain-containing protein [Burkholderia gladioli]ASD81832.1 hypothetical protein CEJ98_22840 [Burkholderia gladioli pv. gladioli]AWY52084.1 hypothetical protein A8H28_13375 [Burkholderia gladioli pv. gladioli]MDJ1165591.1 LysR substrate-binding domain-containing protein [Burkholderia gladioli pv. gladioli]MDN7814221.1 LysR substrate-binding domain-containing protein [Burkholderia gladioli]SPV14711.1 LysR family transcriptional regulator [Burkholderia gladioli]